MTSSHNQTYEDTDLTLFSYGGDYWHEENWNVSTGISGGSYHFSNAPNAKVTFQFPVPAIAFYYYGLVRHDKNPGVNRICFDCSDQTGGFAIETNNVINSVDDVNAQPILLFSQKFSKPENHTVVLWNVPDSSIPSPGSRISLDRFELELETGDCSAGTRLPVTTQNNGIPIPTFIGALVGSNVALLLLGIGLLLLNRWNRRRRERHRQPKHFDSPPPFDPRAAVAEPFLGGGASYYPRSSASEYDTNYLIPLDQPYDPWDGISNRPVPPISPPLYHAAGLYGKR